MYAPKRRRRKYIGAAASCFVEPYAVAVSKRSEVPQELLQAGVREYDP